MAASYTDLTHRPIKKPRTSFGPDVYPQEPRQKEDELTPNNVKHGFVNQSSISEETGTARNSNWTRERLTSFYNSIQAARLEVNTVPDNAKKKPPVNVRDNFWLVVSKPKAAHEAWFKELGGSKSLLQLARKMPIFNKKDDIFMTLCENNICMGRAAWFIKMTNAYNTTLAEARIRGRKAPDPFADWSQALCKFLKEQLLKIMEHHQGSGSSSGTQTSFLTTGSSSMIDIDSANKNWNYCTQLAKHMYDEGLLDRQDFLNWLLELLEKEKIRDDSVLKIVIKQVLRYINEFALSQLLSRRLAHFCCRKIQQFVDAAGCSHEPAPPANNGATTGQQNSSTPNNNNATTTTANAGNNNNATAGPATPGGANNNTATTTPAGGNGTAAQPAPAAAPAAPPLTTLSPLGTVFAEYNSCPQHRGLVLSLCAIVQSLLLECPAAFVWLNIGENKQNSPLYGSPLDLLPCSPSCLPLAPGTDTNIRRTLMAQEKQIVLRSMASEMHWSADKHAPQASRGFIITKVLFVLDILDRHNFDRVESSSALDHLYNKMFHHRENEAQIGEEAMINLLCDWAVSTQRSGEHRAIVVAKLIEKRQMEITAEKYADGDGDDKSEMETDLLTPAGAIPFQPLLMSFLDNKAPTLDNNASHEQRQAFGNLVLLFSELLRHEVFSHDNYMCTLISRGDLSNFSMSPHGALHAAGMLGGMTGHNSASSSILLVEGGGGGGAGAGAGELSSVKSDPNAQMEMKMELENQNFDSEFDIFAFKPSPKLSPVGSTCSVIEQGPLSCNPPTPASKTPGNTHTTSMAGTPGGTSHTPGAADTPVGGGTHSPRLLIPPPPAPVVQEQRALKHLCYLNHFPIVTPVMLNTAGSSSSGGAGQAGDDVTASYSHESNQRMLTLYGVGKKREEVRHNIRRLNKDLLKLYAKKSCLDAVTGEVRKRGEKKKDAVDPEQCFSKFRKLAYFDQHAVTQNCAAQVMDVVTAFSAGTSVYLPVIDNISFLLNLMENALNIAGLLDFSVAILKELAEVEQQLQNRNSPLTNHYTTTLSLHFVAAMRKYQAYLYVNHDLMLTAFDSLRRIVYRVASPADCTSEERCILAYLYDVFTTCSYVKNKMSDVFGPTVKKLTQTMYVRLLPSASNLRWDPQYLTDLLNNPKSKIRDSVVNQLKEDFNRYSFVCNAVLMVCLSRNVETVNDVSILCAQLTARCTQLSSEWLGVLRALCCSEAQNACGYGYYDILARIDVSDLSIHDSLAVFTSILIARHCFGVADLVHNVALHSLVAACLTTPDPEAETGARLTCHLLLRLLRTCDTPAAGGGAALSSSSYSAATAPTMYVHSTCDVHLLEAAHNCLLVGAVVAVLKAMLMLADRSNSQPKESPPPKKDQEDIFQTMLQSLENNSFDSLNGSTSKQASGLSDYAKLALKQICTQHWVREKFLKDPESLFTSELLLDNMLQHQHVQQLVQMICYPNGVPPLPPASAMPSCEDDDEDEDAALQKRDISRILLNMEQWSVRVAWLELQLMFKLAESSDMEQLLSDTAACTINVFVQQTRRDMAQQLKTHRQQQPTGMELETDSIWLIAPLIGKLGPAVQGRVLKAAGQKLETGNNFWTAKNAKEKESYLQKSISLLGNQPFLSLVRTCLKGHDEQREGLLKSLNEQLEKFVSNTKEPQDRGIPNDEHLRDMMQTSLQLRLSLVGSMFDSIQRSNGLTQDWAYLLSQLMSHGVVEIGVNAYTMTLVLDMLSTLLYGALVISETSEKSDDKKLYQTIIRKLKREIGDKKTESMDLARQLLPLPKKFLEIVTNDPYKSYKGKTISVMDPKKGGYQLAVTKQKLSPWEILDHQKNPAPLSLSWFGAVKLDKKVLIHEEHFKLSLYHKHSLYKPPSHYLDAPPLPPEELEPPPEPKKEEPMETKVVAPMQDDGRKKKANKRRTRVNTPTHTPTFGAPISTPGGPPMYQQPQPAVRPDMYQPQQAPLPPPPGWTTTPNPYQHPQYTQPQPQPLQAARYGGPPKTKDAIKTYLHNRGQLQPGPGSMYSGPVNPVMQPMMMARAPLRQRLYRHQSGYQVMGPPGMGGMSGDGSGFSGGGGGPGYGMGGGGMQGQPATSYMNPQISQAQQQFNNTPRYGMGPGSSVTAGGNMSMAGAGGGGMPPGMSSGGSVYGGAGGAGYTAGMQGGMSNMSPQQMAQLRQQRMVMMQQQQQQQQQQQPQQQMFGGMQRQMSNPGQPQPPSYYGSTPY